MLKQVHGALTQLNVDVTFVPAADTIIIPATTNPVSYIFIHELIGDLDIASTLTIKTTGSQTRTLATFKLDPAQGITLSVLANEDGLPRFEIYPGENFVINSSAAANLAGNILYSLRT